MAFALAAAIHVALFVSARQILVPPASLTAPAPTSDAIDLDLAPVATDPGASTPTPTPTPAERTATATATAAAALSVVAHPPALVTDAIGPPHADDSLARNANAATSASAGNLLAPGNDSAWTLSATRPAVDLGIGTAKYGASGAVSPNDQMSTSASSASSATTATDGNGATDSVLAALDAHDVDAGLARGGPILTAIEEATHSSEAPMIGVAVFDVTVLAGGGLTVDLISADKAHEGWDHLRGLIATEAGAKHTRLPPGGLGVRFRVRVEAVERLADGTDTRTVGKVKNNSHVGTMERTGDRDDMPHLQADYQTRVCHMTAGVDPLGPYAGLGCSPENLVPARRIVAARVISETRL